MISVLIPAAGSGLRLGSRSPKALVPIADRPMLAWSVDALSRVDGVKEVLVAAPADSLKSFEDLCRQLLIPKWERVIEGGATRQQSVSRLLDAATAARVLVHDAARPCVKTIWVNALLAELGSERAGLPAVPVRDTLKRGHDKKVVETIDRSELFIAQTPQIFDADLLRRAHGAIGSVDATDDAMLIERLGETVKLLHGDPGNIKITYPDDVALAEMLLRAG